MVNIKLWNSLYTSPLLNMKFEGVRANILQVLGNNVVVDR